MRPSDFHRIARSGGENTCRRAAKAALISIGNLEEWRAAAHLMSNGPGVQR